MSRPRSGRSPSRRTSSSRPSSRRPAAARSCAACCGTSPSTASWATPPPWPTRRWWRRSRSRRSPTTTLDSPVAGGTILSGMEATEQLMPIGRFARLTGLTVKALRHYDEVGLLRPAAVDPETGYRSYAPEQVRRAETIRKLRRLDLPLDDVITLLETDDPELV